MTDRLDALYVLYCLLVVLSSAENRWQFSAIRTYAALFGPGGWKRAPNLPKHHRPLFFLLLLLCSGIRMKYFDLIYGSETDPVLLLILLSFLLFLFGDDLLKRLYVHGYCARTWPRAELHCTLTVQSQIRVYGDNRNWNPNHNPNPTNKRILL